MRRDWPRVGSKIALIDGVEGLLRGTKGWIPKKLFVFEQIKAFAMSVECDETEMLLLCMERNEQLQKRRGRSSSPSPSPPHGSWPVDTTRPLHADETVNTE